MPRTITSATTLDGLKHEAKQWLKALRAGDPGARARLRAAHPSAPDDAGLRQVQHGLAREFGFASWAHLKRALALARAALDAARPPLTIVGDASSTAVDRVRALLSAADAGDAAAVAAVLEREPALIDVRGTLVGHTGLRTALHFGVAHEAVVRVLLERGADPNVRDEGDNAFPLHFAAENQDLPVIRLLVEHGAEMIGEGDEHELGILGWATCWDSITVQPEVLDYLLAHGARHHVCSAVAVGDVAALRGAVAADPRELARVMDGTNRRRTPLHLAVVKQQPAALDALLELGADTEAVDAAGLTPLDQAALAGETAMAARLMAHGAVLRLPAAVALGRAGDVERLVRAEPGALGPDGRWRTLMIRAAERGSGDLIETLVRLGASVDAIDDAETAVDNTGGYTALHAAAWRGNVSAIDALLRLGANPRIRDHKYCATAAGWADYAGRHTARDRILQADIDIFDAITFELADRVHALLDADPALLERPFGEHPGADMPWCTPLAAAALSDKPSMVRLLLARGAKRITSPDGRPLLELVHDRGLLRVAAELQS